MLLRNGSLRGRLQQEYEDEEKSKAHAHDSCGMPTVVAFDGNRSSGLDLCLGFHVLLPLRIGTAGLDPFANSDIQADEAFGRNGP